MEMDQKLIQALLDAFDRSDWQEMAVTIGSDRLHVSRRAEANGALGEAAPAREQAPPVADVPASLPADGRRSEPPSAAHVHAEQMHASAEPLTGTVVESPSVGLFWRAPSPGAPPFVERGARVAAGDTLAIVEVMKLMNHIVSPAAGIVKAILPGNGDTVEYGQPLFVLDAEV
jgi:acetyl-CoA carboxylase biotin carboxyl carrier protein